MLALLATAIGASDDVPVAPATAQPQLQPADDLKEPECPYDEKQLDNLSLDEIVQKNTSNGVRDIQKFLVTEYVTEKGNPHTNLISRSNGKTYNIPAGAVEGFFKVLDAARREHPPPLLHYLERQTTDARPYSGIMIDFDVYQRTRDRLLDQKRIGTICRLITNIIIGGLQWESGVDLDEVAAATASDETYDLGVEDGLACPLGIPSDNVLNMQKARRRHRFGQKMDESMVGCEPGVLNTEFKMFVIMKDAPVNSPQADPTAAAVYKDGLHILIPEIWVSKGFKRYLVDKLSKQVVNIFRGEPIVGDPSKIVDKGSYFVPVHFFGCSKPGRAAYKLAYVVNCTIDSDGDHERASGAAAAVPAAQWLQENNEHNLAYELSLSFVLDSVGGRQPRIKKRIYRHRVHLDAEIKVALEKTGGAVSDEDILMTENSVDIITLGNSEAAHIKSLLAILDISFATEYEKWYKVLCAIAHSSHNYKPLALWFSQRKPDSFSAEEFERAWGEATRGKFQRAPVTVGSLREWARASSPRAFADAEEENCVKITSREAYENEGSIEHFGAAKILRSLVANKFVCDYGSIPGVPRADYHWFEFVTPGQSMVKGEVFKWRREHSPDNMHLFMGEHMPKIYKRLLEKMKENMANAANDSIAKWWKNTITNFKVSKRSLGKAQYQDSVIRMARFQFRQRGFIQELDTYEDVIGVGNGVLVLGPQPRLIRGFHEYKISKFTRTEYFEYDPERPTIKRLEDAMRNNFVEDDVYKFYMMHKSTCLDQYPASYLLFLYIGAGGQGKSTGETLTQETLGTDFMASGKPELLTDLNERAQSPNSALMHMQGKRGFYFDEFNKNAILNPARVKAIVSPGYQSGRDLHVTQTNFKTVCNPTAISNYDFMIPTTDHGIWRRIYYYKSKVKYCDNPNPDNPLERLADAQLEKDICKPEYHEAWLSILVEWNRRLWTEYGGDIRKVPVPSIIAQTEAFRNRNDLLNKFLTTSVVKSPAAERMGLTKLADKYAEWYRRETKKELQDTTHAIVQDLENSRISKFITTENNDIKYVYGIRIKAYLEEPLEDDESMLFGQAQCLADILKEEGDDKTILGGI